MLSSKPSGRVAQLDRVSASEAGTLQPSQRRSARKYRPRGESPLDRVNAFVDSSGGSEACWPFRGTTDADGYGRINSGKRTLSAHKLTLEAKLGRPLGADEVTRHKCHNPPCCNPEHLIPGTRADNVADMVVAGRALAGERGPGAKLTEQQVREILARLSTGAAVYERLGAEYGVTGKAIALIAAGKRWGHLACSTQAGCAPSNHDAGVAALYLAGLAAGLTPAQSRANVLRCRAGGGR